MVDFSAGYVPPGVFVDSESTSGLAAVGVGATVVCLVGPGIGYQTFTETLSFASVNSKPLSKKFVVEASIVVSAVLDSGRTVFVEDTTSPSATNDYAVATDSGTHITTITRHSSGDIPTDRPVTVTYHYADDDYFGVNKFSDFGTLAQVYGNPLDPVTGDIASPVSFAAQLAFRNGARLLYVVAPDTRASGTTQEHFAAAYAKTIGNYEINLVVPIWPPVQAQSSATSYIADVAGHLEAAEAAAQPRMALCGVGQGYVTTDIDAVAQSVATKRIVLFWPQAYTYFNSVLNGTAVADGYYFAAAASGVLVGNDLNRGLTRSQINTFTAIAPVGQGYTEIQKNTWASRGVSVAEMNRTGALIVRHGLTTDMTNVGTREISIVRSNDAVFETIALTLEGAGLIGDPIDEDTVLNIKSLVQGAMEGLVSSNTINSYQNITTSQGTLPGGDPTVITVTLDYFPTYPINYITVTFTLDLTTGNLTASSDNGTSTATVTTTP